MKIGIVDADLVGKKKQRFPNLACMKISAWYKNQGDIVELLLDYDTIEDYDKVFISKVFTDTVVPSEVLNLSWVEYGGTGFFYDKAPSLPDEIEHIKPDYHLYDEWVAQKLSEGVKPKELQYYTDFSIGFTTRGCIRGCSFCVNKNYRQCNKHSPVSEFLDTDRKYICLLDDNILSCPQWKEIFSELQATGKRFQFKQGLDERLLTDEKCETLFNSNWIGDFIFAFDNIKDCRLVERKLQLIRKHTNKIPKFYVFCGYNHDAPNTYSDEFWVNDIIDLFERIRILMNYNCLPYVMRYADYKDSPFVSLYNTIAAWCNQPSFFKKKSFREYCEMGYTLNRKHLVKCLTDMESKYPHIVEKYFDMKWKGEELKDEQI